MCGIAGFLGGASECATAIAWEMAHKLKHRGPDDSAIFSEPGITLVHTRLSIIDLSTAGRQPMSSSGNRVVIVFNGEIYNHREIRRELKDCGVRFKGHSDTEVLLEAVERWGLNKALEKAEGMFSLALWDRVAHRLFLARDRFGEKPLYYGWIGSAFVFASELKALRVFPGFDGELDVRVFPEFLMSGFIPGTLSIYKKISKLPPGTIAEVSPDVAGKIGLRRFWNICSVVEDCLRNPFPNSDGDIDDRFDQVFRSAVRGRMEADVPLGLFLSGGIDSSLVAAVAQAEISRPVQTFTATFDDPRFDESRAAKGIATRLGTIHEEVRVASAAMLEAVPTLSSVFDEPFADPSQVPTLVLSRLTRTRVAVALSGDGGDELFWGYRRFFVAQRFWSISRSIPDPLRVALSVGLSILPPHPISWIGDAIGALSGGKFAAWRTKRILRRLGPVLSLTEFDDVYRGINSYWDHPSEVLIGGLAPVATSAMPAFLPPCSLERLAFDAAIRYLPDDILVKVDRASMAFGLEVRAPFLDRRLFEFAWRLPSGMKVSEAGGKTILKRALARHIPGVSFNLPKRGFTPPIAAWLRGPLRDWAESLLSRDSVLRTGVFEPSGLQRIWREHLSGHWDWHLELWSTLMLQDWLLSERSRRDGVSGPSAKVKPNAR